METVDWRPRKLRFKQTKKTLLRRVLVVSPVKVTFLFLFVSRAELQQPFVIVHPGLASIFKITTALHAVCTATLTCHVKFEFVWFSVVIFPDSRATSQIRKRSISPYSLLWESGLLATVTLKVAYQAATKDEKRSKINFPKIEYKPFLSSYYNSTKQNDSVRMVFPEDSSRLYLRTALRFVETPNTESRNPTDC